MRVRTQIGAVEMLKRGITAVHDDAYHVPAATAAPLVPGLSTHPARIAAHMKKNPPRTIDRPMNTGSPFW